METHQHGDPGKCGLATHGNATGELATRRLAVPQLVQKLGSGSRAYNQVGMDHTSLCRWTRRFLSQGLEGVQELPPIYKTHPAVTPPDIQERVGALATGRPTPGCNFFSDQLTREGIFLPVRTVNRRLNGRQERLSAEHWLCSRSERAILLQGRPGKYNLMDATAPTNADTAGALANLCVPELKSRTVDRIVTREHLKTALLSDGTSLPDLPLSACVTKGDPIEWEGIAAYVPCKNGRTQIFPSYSAQERVATGGLVLQLVVKEITEEAEYRAYRSLAQYHYRDQVLWGRTARLVLRCFHPMYPPVIGYIELTSPFYMNKARRAILNAPFKANGVSWDSWDLATARRYIHLMARIARCVIYPEFRGLGLGSILVRHAADFARHRWQVAQVKPYFLEISADMLKFVPFAERAGMVFAGETEGNLGRVRKDVQHLLAQNGELTGNRGFSIANQQVVRFRKLQATMEREGLAPSEVLGRLSRLTSDEALADYHLFHEVLSLPKPTYLQGLVPAAEEFLRERATLAAAGAYEPTVKPEMQPLVGEIVLRNFTLTHTSSVERTPLTHAIQQAFGISPDNIIHRIINSLSLTIKPGSVLLITGPSGTGKTSLLKALGRQAIGEPDGEISFPENFRPGFLEPIESEQPLIEVFAKGDARGALHLMGTVGLSDAFLYLKTFSELSNGQQYRAMLAKLISDGANCWMADEFCSQLDHITANVVAQRLQRSARQLGATLIVATSRPEHLLLSLQPDEVLQLSSAWEYWLGSGDEYQQKVRSVPLTYGPQTLHMDPDYVPLIRLGTKRSTIRKGRKDLHLGFALISAGTECLPVTVTSVRHTRLKCLGEDDARTDGFRSVSELLDALAKHYPGLTSNSWVTVVRFTSANQGRV